MHIYKVHIRANVNTWRGSDYQTVPLYVLSEKENIQELILKRSDDVYAYFDKKRNGAKRLVSFPIKKNLFIKDFGLIEKLEAKTFSVMTLTECGFRRIEL